MKMTSKKPTEVGAYWCYDKYDNPSRPEVVMVREYGRELAIHNCALRHCDEDRYLWSEKIEDPEF